MSASIFLLFINLSMNLVVGLNVFGTFTPSPMTNTSISNITTVEGVDIASILTNNLTAIFAGEIIVSLLIIVNCIRTGSYAILGPLIFIWIFWNSWLVNTALIGSSGYFNNGPMLTLYTILSGAMAFIFIGAVAGMVGGND